MIETSGSAFPATLAMEVNRLARQTEGAYVLDGVVTVIDVENWMGYEDTSVTAKLQARFTDLIVFNKWEEAGERRFDECLDRLGDLEGVEVAWVKSDRGSVPSDLVFGVDGGLARGLGDGSDAHDHAHAGQNGHSHDVAKGHQSEVEVLSITLEAENETDVVVLDTARLENLLQKAPKDEVYRIKAVLTASSPILSSDSDASSVEVPPGPSRYILNWAFGRWTCTRMPVSVEEHESSDGIILRMTMILAQYQGNKWKKRIETGDFVSLKDGHRGALKVEKIT